MDEIILDITGFYFSKTYRGEMLELAVGKTVQELTTMSKGVIGDNGRGKLTEVEFKPGAIPGLFLQKLTVDFMETKPPKSRQKGSIFGDPPQGVYGYTDLATKVVSGEGVSFTPVWQYYHFDKKRRLKSGAPLNKPTQRKIVPADRSEKLQPGDRVVWRLVLIGGVFERVAKGRRNNPQLAEQMRQDQATSIATMAMLTEDE
ncbi:MAG: hypothetical protein AAF939_20205 [Planctomycetota bacterium]